jgi:nicotinamidase/pyrazinamidase
MPKKRVDLLIIDPQTDFCDPNGKLAVAGADEDMTRLARLIDRIGSGISNIHITMDSHHKIDCSHPLMWRNSAGEHPDPFTTITSDVVKKGEWIPIFPQYTQRMINYEEGLEANGKYPHTIWPEHCIIGTDGHKIFPVLNEALERWVESKERNLNIVTKGSNIWTEHYSAVKAEVPDPDDSTTQINTSLINTLQEADIILVAGEAGSHCLKFTVEDIADAFDDDSYIQKLVLLQDATSPVADPDGMFATAQTDMISTMSGRGMQLSNTADYAA